LLEEHNTMLDLHVASASKMEEAGVFGSACDASNHIGFADHLKVILVTAGHDGKAITKIDTVGLIDSYAMMSTVYLCDATRSLHG
jgi:hypothetical protein